MGASFATEGVVRRRTSFFFAVSSYLTDMTSHVPAGVMQTLQKTLEELWKLLSEGMHYISALRTVYSCQQSCHLGSCYVVFRAEGHVRIAGNQALLRQGAYSLI